MKKKITNRALNYFTNHDIPIIIKDSRYPDMLTKANKEILKRVCNDEEIKKIERDFNKFYKFIFDYCTDDETEALLESLEEHIKQTYFIYMSNLIELEPSIGKDRISNASRQLFFLADLVIASVIGKNNTLKMFLERYEKMTGRKLSEEKKKVLLKIIIKRNELKKNEYTIRKFSLKYVIATVYGKLSVQEKRILLFHSEDLEVDVPIKLNDKSIKTISETIRYHQNKGNLPK